MPLSTRTDCPVMKCYGGAKEHGELAVLLECAVAFQGNSGESGLLDILHGLARLIGADLAHEHRQCCYIVKGRFLARVDGEPRELGAGDCLYAQANVPHGLEDDSVVLDIFTPRRDDFLAAK